MVFTSPSSHGVPSGAGLFSFSGSQSSWSQIPSPSVSPPSKAHGLQSVNPKCMEPKRLLPPRTIGARSGLLSGFLARLNVDLAAAPKAKFPSSQLAPYPNCKAFLEFLTDI